jgi:hypothetical protein
MTVVIAEHELVHSCQVLFGADTNITRGFLEYLQLAGIKSAYRKKAFETHPDVLASSNGRQAQQNGDLFQVVQQAYENLKGYLEARERGFRFKVVSPPPYRAQSYPAATKKSWSKPAPPQETQTQWPGAKKYTTTNQAKPNAGRNHQSNSKCYTSWSQNSINRSIPSRQLLFGHYLYYSGIATWQTVIKAIVWQRTERPRIGELARKYGWLSSQDILAILKGRKLSDPFGKSAISMGMLTRAQLRILLFQQKRLQKKFGQYFVQNKLMTAFELQRLVHQFYSHNSFAAQQGTSYRGRM